MKESYFKIAALAYTAATAISVWEIFQEKSKKGKALAATEAAQKQAILGEPIPPAPALIPHPTLALISGSNAVLKMAITKDLSASQKNDLVAKAALLAPAGADANATTQATLATIHNANVQWAATAKTAAAVPTHPVAKPLIAKAAVAVANWAVYKQTVTCVPIGAPAPATTSVGYKSAESLYASYSSPSKFDLKAEIQLANNIQSSSDLASFFINQNQFEGNQNTSPQIYDEYKNLLGELNEDPTILELFKVAASTIMNNVNPIQIAQAREFDQTESAQSEFLPGSESSGASNTGSGSSGSSSSSGTTVDSNAAKSFVAEKGKAPIPWFAVLGAGAYFTAKSKIGAKMVTSSSRAIFSGIMALMTLQMSKHAGEQASAAGKRAELLRKMQADFDDASSALYACKSEDRNDPGKANCYCYTAEGGRNQNRGNSQICQKMWGKLSFKPGQYLGGDGTSTCVTNTRAADPKCDCKKNNSCLRVAMPKISGFGAGNLNMMNSAMDDLNRINDGSISSAQIDSAGIENKAAKLRGLIKKLEDQKGMEGFKKEKEEMEKAMLADLQKSSSGFGSNGGGLGALAGSNLPSSAAEAAKELEKELKFDPQGFSGGGEIAVPLNAGAEEGMPEFGLSEEGALAQETAMAEVMKEDLDFGGNDINSGSKTNIFELLSNRYQRSGMRRLFDEKGETKADEAAKSDIAD